MSFRGLEETQLSTQEKGGVRKVIDAIRVVLTNTVVSGVVNDEGGGTDERHLHDWAPTYHEPT